MAAIYPARESKTLEFKSYLPSFDKLVKTCVGFANGAGGKIIIGVDDNGEIMGIDENTRDRIYDEFTNSLYDSTEPKLFAEIYEKNFEEHNVLIIEIFPSNKKPVFVKKEGIPIGVYLRVGSNTRRANEPYIEELIRENKRRTYDEEVLHENITILSDELLKQHFKKVDKKRLINEKIICQSSTQLDKYFPTMAGVLMFSERPDLYINEAVIRCTRFQGVEGRDIIQSEEIHGSLEEQIETSFQLIKSWLIRDYKLQGTKLKGEMLIPEEALREVIVNAVIHRKYSISGAIKIALFDDRLEIFNPGDFPGLMDIEQLGDGTTYLRNPTIARIARHMGIMEKLGSGIRLILDSCKKAGIKAPQYIEGADNIKVIFSFVPSEEVRKFTFSVEQVILAMFAFRDELKINDITKYFNISRNTATRKLNKLIEKGLIQRHGKGPNTLYFKIK